LSTVCTHAITHTRDTTRACRCMQQKSKCTKITRDSQHALARLSTKEDITWPWRHLHTAAFTAAEQLQLLSVHNTKWCSGNFLFGERLPPLPPLLPPTLPAFAFPIPFSGKQGIWGPVPEIFWNSSLLYMGFSTFWHSKNGLEICTFYVTISTRCWDGEHLVGVTPPGYCTTTPIATSSPTILMKFQCNHRIWHQIHVGWPVGNGTIS